MNKEQKNKIIELAKEKARQLVENEIDGNLGKPSESVDDESALWDILDREPTKADAEFFNEETKKEVERLLSEDDDNEWYL